MPAGRPTLPSEPRSRRLGVGGGPAGGDRVVQAQVVIAFVLVFTVLAVLLYLLRRPTAAPAVESPSPSASSSSAAPAPVIVRTKIEPPKEAAAKVKLGAVQHVKCGASAKLTSTDSCDALPFFEQALAAAINETVDCAPKQAGEGSINYVLTVDFRTHDLRVYPGRSGSLRGKLSKKASDCVLRALKQPTWDSLSHQYRYYVMAILATYPPQNGVEGLPDFK